MNHRLLALLTAFLVSIASACSAAESGGDGGSVQKRLFIIGQDLGSVRDYTASECCPAVDGNTAYLNFYSLLSPESGYGGLGIDLQGEPIVSEFDWGAGVANAWKSATGFEGGLAIGLSITENDNPDGLSRIVAGDFDGGYTDIRQWYPGDEYVDWLGVSLFLLLDEGPAIETEFVPPTVRELIGKVLELARERGKPVFIAEASPQGYDLSRGTNAHITPAWDGRQGEGRKNVSPEEIWDQWYAPVFELLEENRDVIHAIAYINCNWDVQDMWDAPYEAGYWGDSRLQVSPVLAARFTAAIEQWRRRE
jgi:hypothetical protein